MDVELTLVLPDGATVVRQFDGGATLADVRAAVIGSTAFAVAGYLADFELVANGSRLGGPDTLDKRGFGPAATVVVDAIRLTAHQSKVRRRVTSPGRHWLITGQAGTGKTRVIKAAVEDMLKAGCAVVITANNRLPVNAFAGLASRYPRSCRLGTAASLTGIGLGGVGSIVPKMPSATFARWIAKNDARVCPQSTAPGNRMVLIVLEVGMLAGQMIDQLWLCMSMIKSAKLGNMILEGDLTQMQSPDTDAAPPTMSIPFKGRQLTAVALVEQQRYSGKLKWLVDGLRNPSVGVPTAVREWLYTKHLQTCNQRPRHPDLVITTARAHAASWRKKLIKHRNDAARDAGEDPVTVVFTAVPVGRKRKRATTDPPAPVMLTRGASVRFTRNGANGVANGDMGTVVSWPFAGDPAFAEVDCDDEEVTSVTVRHHRTDEEITVCPVVDGAWKVMPVIESCAATIAQLQGLTVPPTMTVGMDFSYGSPWSPWQVRTLLYSMMSRCTNEAQIEFIRFGNDPLADNAFEAITPPVGGSNAANYWACMVRLLALEADTERLLASTPPAVSAASP